MPGSVKVMLGSFGILLILTIAFPEIDLWVADLFRSGHAGFVWRARPLPNFLHEAIQIISRALALGLTLGLGLALLRYRQIHGGWNRQLWDSVLLRVPLRQWLFLLLALVVGPALLANVVLKDNWGRARPVQVENFGGDHPHTPPLIISNACDSNCSFVAGDAAIAFYLHSFAYLAHSRRRRRQLLAVGMAAGMAGGLLRIGMGAHFFSDVLFAGVFMVAASAVVHGFLFGWEATLAWWRSVMQTAAPPSSSG